MLPLSCREVLLSWAQEPFFFLTSHSSYSRHFPPSAIAGEAPASQLPWHLIPIVSRANHSACLRTLQHDAESVDWSGFGLAMRPEAAVSMCGYQAEATLQDEARHASIGHAHGQHLILRASRMVWSVVT